LLFKIQLKFKIFNLKLSEKSKINRDKF